MSISSRIRGAFAALAGRVSKADVPVEPVATPSSIQRPGPRKTYTGQRAKGLTPQRVAQLLRDAEMGNPAAFCELIDEVTGRDGHNLAVLGTRKRAVANLDWTVDAASDDRRDLDVAAFVADALDGIENFEDGLLDLLDGIPKGFAIVENEWVIRGNQALIGSFRYCPQQWFKPDPEDPRAWRLLSDEHPVLGRALDPHRFTVHTPKARPGFPVSAGLGSVLVWWWLFKSYAIKDWVSYSEMFGAPLRIGKFPAGAAGEDIDALDEALRQLGVDASAVIPDDMKVEFHSDTGPRTGADVYERLAKYADREVSKAVLGQTLTTEEGARGTQALGSVHNEVRQDLVVADAKQLARTIRREVIGPLVLFNFGPDVALPRFTFDTEPAPDEAAEVTRQQGRAGVFAAAANMGIQVAVSQVQEELDLREPQKGEPTLTPTPTTPAESALPAATTAVPSSVVAAATSPSHACPKCGGVHLPMSDKDRGLPSTRRQLDGFLEQATERKVKRPWASIVRQLGADIGSGMAPEQALERLALGDLVDGLADLDHTAQTIGEAQVAAGDRPVDLPSGTYAEDSDGWDGLFDEPRPEVDEGQRLARRRARRAAAYGLLGATDELEAVRDDREALEATTAREASGSRVAQSQDALTNIGWNRGRRRQQERQAARRPYFRYMTRQDDRVRDSHRPMHGWVALASHPIWNVWRPPNGWGCRCWVETFTQAEVDAQGFRIREDLPRDNFGSPLTPDIGWQRDKTREDSYQYDWSAFPESWRRAIGVDAPEEAE